MERICEFCAKLRPVIYCKPDAARLCLSCDAKVHSANALSSRHLRTLLCDLCRNFPTYLQCLDHQMFLCRNCDCNLHGSLSQHQKRNIRGYMGCPSARDFATLWGFEMNELDDGSKDSFVFTCGSETSGITTLDSCSYAEHKVGSLTHQTKMLYRGQEQRTFILQQILDLSRVQLIKANSHSPFIGREGKDGIPSSVPHTSEKFDESQEPGTDGRQRGHLLQELKMTQVPNLFSQLENMSVSSGIVLPLHGDSLWQCKSPAETESSQSWSQNMQDLGFCDDLVSHDDFNIPEVDLTFQNFEDIFDDDQDHIRGELDTKDESFSSMDKDMSLDKSDNLQGKAVEEIPVSSLTPIFPSALMDKDQVCHPPTSTESARPIRPSSSFLSISDSRLSVDSVGSNCLDSRRLGEPSCTSPCHRHQKHGHSMADKDAAKREKKNENNLNYE